MRKDKSAAKPHRVRTKMPVGQRKTVYTDSVTNNIPVPMRKAISGNCTSLPPMPMSANTCRRCWKIYPKVRPSMPTKAMTARKTGNIWKSIGYRTALCAKPAATVRCRKSKPNATDICRRPVMWSNKASVRCTVNSAMRGQPILVCPK